MDRAAMHLDGALDRLPEVDSEEMLCGVEGAAAAAYFTAFDRMVRRHLRRHPDSPAVRDLRGQGRAPRREGRRRAAAGGLPGDLRTAWSSQADLRSIPPRPTSEA